MTSGSEAIATQQGLEWLGQKIWAATFYAASKGIISYRLAVSGASDQDEISP